MVAALLRQAVILAGGLGTRLGDLTRSTPKPLLAVGGYPFLEHVVWNLRRQGIDDIILSVGHLARSIKEHFGDGSTFGVRVRYVVEATPAGTGGALRLCAPLLDERFVLLNGDTLFDLNIRDLDLQFRRLGTMACMALRPVPDVSRYGGVALREGRVIRFAEKAGPGAGLVNGGVIVFRRDVIAALPEGPSSLERDLMPGLVAAGQVAGKAYEGYFLDIGLHKTLEQAQTEIPRWRRKGALLLDRDGVLNVDHGYVHKPEQFEWVRGAREAVKLANDAGLLVLVVTNQAGIARGYYDAAQFQALMQWVNWQLADDGAYLDAWYFCPHHPTEGFGELRQACNCRKPAPGMLLAARREWDFDPDASLMIGDKPGDMEAAVAAGVHGRLLGPGDDLLALVQSEMPRMVAGQLQAMAT